MGRINISDLDNYTNSNGNTKFFKLENDKDTAVVRFMLNTVDDLEPVIVHEITIGDKTRLVNCLRTYDENQENCPLCRAGNRQLPKLFIPVFSEKDNEVRFWQKNPSKKFIESLYGAFRRCGNPIVSTRVEIERNGAKGEKTTTYTMYPGQSDNTKLEDLPEIPEVVGSFVMDKSYDELCKYVEKGFFEGDVAPVNREQTTISRRETPAPTRPKF